MAKTKKLLKKLAKAALIGGALYGGSKLLGRKRATDAPGNAFAKAKRLLTSNAAYRGRGRQSEGMDLSGATNRGGIIPEDYNINPNALAAKGGRIGKKHGGRTGKQFGGGLGSTARRDMRSGYYPDDMGMRGGRMYEKGGRVKSMGVAKRGGGVAKR